MCGNEGDISCWDGSLACTEEECPEEPTCDDFLVTISVGGGTYDSEITWEFADGSGGAPSTTSFCLVGGDYDFTGCDSWGDGWNGATVDIFVDGILYNSWTGPASGLSFPDCETVTFYVGSDAPVPGCTDPIAENYNPDATMDDGSCEYIMGCTDPNAPEYNADATSDDGSCWADCAGVTSYIGDGYCDSSNNNEGCGYDGGDCCPTSCWENVDAGCPGNPAGCYGTPGSNCGECLDYSGNPECMDPSSPDLTDGGACDPNADPPAAPEDLVCAGNWNAYTNTPTIDLTWSPVEGASSYNVYQVCGAVCWDGSCAESEEDCPDEPDGGLQNCDSCVNDYTELGAECCDVAWDIFGINCESLQNDYNWDCSGCSCPGDEDGWDSSECGEDEATCVYINGVPSDCIPLDAVCDCVCEFLLR